MRHTATVNYHVRSDKPQAFHFDVDGIIGNLVSPDLVPSKVAVQDLRNDVASVNFDDDGITFERHTTAVTSFGTSSAWEATYDEELVALLRSKVGAEEVIVFDHTVRIDDPGAERTPARNVHNDYNEAGAKQRLVDILGPEKARSFEAGHYGFVNIWRPIDAAIKTSPLGFIRSGSIDAKDWMTIQLIYPDRVGQILGVAANNEHDWFFMSDMTPHDVAIFNIYDNKGTPFLGHSALDIDGTTPTTTPRKSIESRTLIRYRDHNPQ